MPYKMGPYLQLARQMWPSYIYLLKRWPDLCRVFILSIICVCSQRFLFSHPWLCFVGVGEILLGLERVLQILLTLECLVLQQNEWMNEWMNECLTTPQHVKQIGCWVSEKSKCMKLSCNKWKNGTSYLAMHSTHFNYEIASYTWLRKKCCCLEWLLLVTPQMWTTNGIKILLSVLIQNYHTSGKNLTLS